MGAIEELVSTEERSGCVGGKGEDGGCVASLGFLRKFGGETGLNSTATTTSASTPTATSGRASHPGIGRAVPEIKATKILGNGTSRGSGVVNICV